MNFQFFSFLESLLDIYLYPAKAGFQNPGIKNKSGPESKVAFRPVCVVYLYLQIRGRW
jgi:hypothetical protein